MSHDSFDEIDGLLARGLSALAPEVEGGDETLAALRPRFQQARRRARVVRVSGVVALLLVIGSVAALAAPSVRRTHVRVEAPPTSAPRPTHHPAPTSTSVVPTTTAPKNSSTSILLPTGGTVPTGVGSATPTTGGAPTTPQTVPGTTPATSPNNAGEGSGGGSRNGGSSPTTTKPNVHSGAVTYSSRGGNIRVRFSGGVLRLISVSAAPGFHPTVETRRSHIIVVRFSNDHEEWRIQVRVDNGRPVHEVDHH